MTHAIHRNVILALLTSFALLSAPLLEAKAKKADPSVQEVFPPVNGTVVFVGDGDTLTVRLEGEEKGRIIRLYGVDSPELKQLYGREAREFTANLVQDQEVTLEVAEKGKYGRLIALVTLQDGRCLNEELVKAGLAWFHHPPVFLTLPDDDQKNQLHIFAKLMLVAKSEKRGLWRGKFPLPPWTHRRRKNTGRTTVFATLRGTRYHRKGCPTLRMGADALSLKIAKGRGLLPCGICKPDVKKGTKP